MVAKQFETFCAVTGFCFFYLQTIFANKYLVGNPNSSDFTIFVAFVQSALIVFIILGIQLGRVLLNQWKNYKFETVWTLSEYSPYEIMKKAMPVSCCYVGLCLSNNWCLKYAGLVFYQIARSMTIIFTVAVCVIVFKKHMSFKILCSCVIVVCGYGLGISQEKSAGTLSMSGLLFGLVLSVFASLNSIFTDTALDIFQHDKDKLIFYNHVNASIIFLPLVIVSNQLTTLFNSESFTDYFFWLFLVISGIIRFGFVWIMAKLVDVTSPLTHLITANFSSVLQTVIAVIYYQSSKQLLWWFSVFLVVSGTTAYAIVRMFEEKKNEDRAKPLDDQKEHLELESG